jgi:ubiquinone/menaquinone biosynthesis C-methylase UbiE
MFVNKVLSCKRCSKILAVENDVYFCKHCLQRYPVKDSVVIMEEAGPEVNLRVSDKFLDLHKLRKEKRYFNRQITSNVEYFGRLHSVNYLDFHAKLLNRDILNSAIIADLGCGQLPYLGAFSGCDIEEYYGLDLHNGSLKVAHENCPESFPLILVQHGLEEVPFLDNSVDIVISSEVLEHLDHPREYLSEVNRILKKDGYLSLSTPCSSIYYYPFNILLLKKSSLWYKRANAHKYWQEALAWHPALQPKILRNWLAEAGFSIKCHRTKLWFYHTPIRIMWRFFSLLEKAGLSEAATLFKKYLNFTDKLLDSNIPVIKWCGIRQFVLCQKVR